MSILDTGRAGLNQALKATDSSTNLANQMQAERSRLAVANKQADSSTMGQMAGLAGSAAVTYGPEAISGLSALGATATPAAEAGIGSAVGAAIPAEGAMIGSSAAGSGLDSSLGTGVGTLGTAGTAAADTALSAGAVGLESAAATGAATLGTDAAVAGGTALAAEGTAAAAASVVPVAGWIAAAGILAYSLFS